MSESYNRKCQKKAYYIQKKSAKTTAAPTAPTVQKCMCGVEVHIKSQLSMRSHHIRCTTYREWFHEGATTRKEPHKIVNTLKQDTNISLENDMMVDDMILDDYVQDVNYVEEYIANNDNADDDDDGNDSDGEYLLTTY